MSNSGSHVIWHQLSPDRQWLGLFVGARQGYGRYLLCRRTRPMAKEPRQMSYAELAQEMWKREDLRAQESRDGEAGRSASTL